MNKWVRVHAECMCSFCEPEVGLEIVDFHGSGMLWTTHLHFWGLAILLHFCSMILLAEHESAGLNPTQTHSQVGQKPFARAILWQATCPCCGSTALQDVRFRVCGLGMLV